MNRNSVIKLALGLCLLVGFNVYSSDKNISIEAVEQTVARAMATFKVPGVAVAIVKDDQVIMAKGFGVRRMGSPEPVDADTLFGIASNTKAFTSAAIAMLIDEGKMDWDDKVTDYLPKFQLHDPYVTREFTIRDMLSHRSGLGLGAGDLMIWPSSNITNQEIVENIRHLKPVSSFRNEYAYDNLMFVLAGEVVAKVSGMPWAQFVQTRILTPLDMKATRMKYSLIEKNNHNIAIPHAPVDDELKPVGGDFLENFQAAGSIASNVNDMSKWLKLQLNGGFMAMDGADEKRLFKQSQSDEMWHPNIMRHVSSFDQEHFRTHFRGYGLGWGLNDYHGYKMVSHTGGIMGMVSRVALIPELKLGVVVLTNQQAGAAFMAISTDIINRYLDVPKQDWVNLYHMRVQKAEQKASEALATVMKNRDAQSKPSLPLAKYAQTYQDNWYGDINIQLVKDSNGKEKLEMAFSRTETLKGVLEHYQYNTFIVRWYDRSTNADAFVNFQLNINGEVERATMEPVSSMTDFSFDFQDLELKPKR